MKKERSLIMQWITVIHQFLVHGISLVPHFVLSAWSSTMIRTASCFTTQFTACSLFSSRILTVVLPTMSSAIYLPCDRSVHHNFHRSFPFILQYQANHRGVDEIWFPLAFPTHHRPAFTLAIFNELVTFSIIVEFKMKISTSSTRRVMMVGRVIDMQKK